MPTNYDPEQIAAIQAYDRKAVSASTRGTWIVAVLVTAALVGWVTLTLTRSHHTSAERPDAFLTTAAPRSAAPAR